MRGLPIGYTQSGKLLRYEVIREAGNLLRMNWMGRKKTRGESSIFVMGPARSGKTSVLAPALYEFEGSMIVPDVKAQLSCIFARHRQKRLGQDVVFINPLRMMADRLGKFPHVAINPLEGMDIRSPECGLQADRIGENIVLMNGQEREPHWPESARDVVSGVTLAVLEYERAEKRDLVTVYEKIAAPDFFEYAQAMVARGNPLVVGRLGRMAGKDAAKRDELSAIHSATMTQFRFLGNQAVMDCLRPSRNQPLLRWQTLRKRATTVFVIVPVQYLSALGRFLRLSMGSALSSLIATGNTAGLPVFLPWDEFAACGYMSIVTDIMALSAGMNLTMMIVIQDAAQLKELYGERLNSFLSVSGCQIFLPPRDLFSARLISDLCGQTEVIARSRSLHIDRMSGEPQVSDSASQHGRPLLSPDDVMAIGADEMLIRVETVPDVILAKRKNYWKDSRYRGLDSDPYHVKKGWW